MGLRRQRPVRHRAGREAAGDRRGRLHLVERDRRAGRHELEQVVQLASAVACSTSSAKPWRRARRSAVPAGGGAAWRVVAAPARGSAGGLGSPPELPRALSARRDRSCRASHDRRAVAGAVLAARRVCGVAPASASIQPSTWSAAITLGLFSWCRLTERSSGLSAPARRRSPPRTAEGVTGEAADSRPPSTSGEPERLEDLRAAVAVDRRDAHLRR